MVRSYVATRVAAGVVLSLAVGFLSYMVTSRVLIPAGYVAGRQAVSTETIRPVAPAELELPPPPTPTEERVPSLSLGPMPPSPEPTTPANPEEEPPIDSDAPNSDAEPAVTAWLKKLPESANAISAPKELSAAVPSPLQEALERPENEPVPPAEPSPLSANATEESPAVAGEVERPAPVSAPVLFVSAERLNLRAGPSTGSAVIAELPRNSRVELISADGRWMRVRTSDGEEGYVSARFLAEEPA